MRKIFLPLLLLVANVCFGQVDLSLGLKAYYPFSGNANDVSGNNNNPVFNNATLTADRLGNPNSAYHFDGVSSYMKILNSATLNTTNKLSLVVWVKPMGFYAGTCHGNAMIMKGDADYLTGNYLLRFDDGPYQNYNNCSMPVDPLHQNFYGNSVQVLPPGYSPYIQANQWYSVIVTYDGNVAKLYVNCELKGTFAQGSATFTNIYDLYFGRLNSASFPYWFNGDLDEVRIYDRALNIDEVNVLGGCAVSEINTYTPVLGLNICDNKLTVEDASTFNTGDTVLMMQMKGAVIDSTNTSSFGNITDYKNAGNYEFNYVKSKVGNIIELKNKLTRQYDIPLGKVQLIRVPYYNSLNVSTTLTCLPWDGSKGGVLVLNVKDTLNLTADINVSGKGFRGGQVVLNIPGTGIYNQTDYAYPSNQIEGARKGEGIAEVSENLIFCRGPLFSGGGGGNSHNAGGGGGGNGGTGGRGGNEWGGSPVVLTNGGIGGKNYTYSITNNKIFMGGAGGAGQANDATGTSGGNGGGIVIIKTNTIKPNSNKIISNGLQGPDCLTINTCADGVGGGGAGGTIMINAQTIISNFQVQTNGGKGADNNINGPNATGPGGGGGGGSLLVNSGALLGNITFSSNGGVAGRALNHGNTNWGSTNGSSGISASGFIIATSTILFQKNIDSVRIKDSLVNCYSFNFKGLAYFNTYSVNTWQWFFGDGATANTQNTSHTYSATGTFIVKLIVTDINGCKDSIIKNITVATSVTPTITITGSNNICKGNPVTFTASTLYGGATPTFQWQKNNNPVGNNSSTYTDLNLNNGDIIQCILTSSLSCAVPTTATSNSITMMVTNAPANIRYPTLSSLVNQPIQLQARNLGGNNYDWKPVVGLNNYIIMNPIFSYSQTQEYRIYITTSAGCLVVDTLQIIVNGKKGLYVPKAFSPNNDGVNDRLYPILVGIKQLLYFRIYNRWGNLVFETNSGNPAFGWDGRLKGNMQPVETYTWTAEAIDVDNIVIKKSGSTLLIR